MTASFDSFGVIGAGAWGTALAVSLQRAGRRVTLGARTSALASVLAERRENARYLPGIRLDSGIQITADMAEAASCEALVLAVPAQHARATCKELARHGIARRPLIVAAKGIELTSHKLMSEVVAAELPDTPVFILSGPSFAVEVAQDLPAALTLASESGGAAVARAMTTPSLRLYTTDDIIGTQIGGAIKNVLAIGCGIAVGRRLGDNARAALITRGIAEITRLGVALGARQETMMGLSGLGDVVLTCSSPQSRNMSFGIQVGQGQDPAAILAATHGVVEGIGTAAAAYGLAYHHGVEMPVVSAVDRILRDHAAVDDIIAELMARPLRNEAA